MLEKERPLGNAERARKLDGTAETGGTAAKATAAARPPRRPGRRRRVLWWVLGAAAAVLVAAAVALAVAARHLEPYVRARIVAGLEQRFHTRVELDQLHVALRAGQRARFGIWAEGRGLRIWPPQRNGGDRAPETALASAPLIDLDSFTFHVPLNYRETEALRIPEVRLEGLKIHIPPKPEREQTGIASAMERHPQEATSGDHPGQAGILQNVVVDKVVCEQAELVLETEKPGKLPLEFDIEKLTLKDLRVGEPMAFEAVLTNARPKGLIRTEGSFGPWATDDPGESALKGAYRFEKANLGEFNGIAGTLSSTGTYQGTLRDISVAGTAEVPDFKLPKFGTEMDLKTDFQARVDGTDGDTYLDDVEARLGGAKFRLKGKVVRVPLNGQQMPVSAETGQSRTGVGRLIDMDVDVPGAPVADFLKLVSRDGAPLLTGDVEARAALGIQPGLQPVPERMKLDGQFRLENARFTNEKIQEKVADLSLRGQGKPGALKATDPASIAEEMEGNFHMADGVIALPDLKYTVTGAEIDLNGTYALDGTLHFDGTARMKATVSQMVGGWKGLLLKPADRFFEKDGAGTLVPVQVRGTRDAPDFAVDLGRLGTHPERPGAASQ